MVSPAGIAAHLPQADQAIKDREAQLLTLERERETVQREMDKVYRAYIDDEISVKTYGAQYRPLEARLAQLEEELRGSKASSTS